MYDISRRKKFKTVGELKEILETISNETEIMICGDSYSYCWFHVEKDNTFVCLDIEDLDDFYE